MQTFLMAAFALLVLAAAGYVQKKIPQFTKGSRRITMTRAVLALVGIAFGLLWAAGAEGTVLQMLAFLVGFGIVHVPAAVILFVKGARGAGKS